MILKSGRVVPNWILQLAFIQFGEATTIAEVIEDIEAIAQDELNVMDPSRLTVDDALEVFKKFNEIRPDYDDVLEDFFEKHGLGRDEYDGDDSDNGDDDNAPDGPEDDALHERPVPLAVFEESRRE